MEVCNFDVKGKEERIHEEQRLEIVVLNAFDISWLVVYKRELRHWWYVIGDSSLE